MRLAEKSVVVTGAGSGFGEGMARRFAAEGARVVVNDINHEAGERVAGELSAAGMTAMFVPGDVGDDGDTKALIDAAVSRHGGLDVMVNNAGVAQVAGPLLEVDEATFDRIFRINVKALYWSARHTVPVFRRQGGGVILNTASTAALRPRPNLAWYNASKGAVVTLTKSMAVELAADNIRVNALAPVAGATGLLGAFMGGDVTQEATERFVASIPLGRLSTAEDIANAALYLVSDEARFITGVCLEVDGGRCI